jgi:hypothetical protein
MNQAPVVLRRAPTVDVTLPADNGDATFKLAFDFAAICKVKEKTGKSLLNGDVWSTIEDNPALLLAVVWAGLQLYHPELTIEDVSHMLLPSHMDGYMAAVLMAWTKVRPTQEDVDPKSELPTTPVAVP